MTSQPPPPLRRDHCPMRGPLARWALFSFLPVLAIVTTLALEKYAHDHFSANMHYRPFLWLAFFAAMYVVFAPDLALAVGMVRFFEWLNRNGYAPGGALGKEIVAVTSVIAVLVLFRYGIWRWGVRRLARGQPAPYSAMLVLMAGAMTAEITTDAWGRGINDMFWPLVPGYDVTTVFALALAWTLVPAVLLLVRDLRRPRRWAGKNDLHPFERPRPLDPPR